METDLCTDDPFRDKIRGILTSAPFKRRGRLQKQGFCRGAELFEGVARSRACFGFLLQIVRTDRRLPIYEHTGGLFRIIVAGLLFESRNSDGPFDDEVRQLIGMDPRVTNWRNNNNSKTSNASLRR